MKEEENLLIFELNIEKEEKKLICGISVFNVVEILETPNITNLPNQENNSVIGVINLRGEIVYVMDLANKIKIDNNKKLKKIIIITDYNNKKQSFLIDNIVKIVKVKKEEIKRPNFLKDNEYIKEIVKVEEELVSILDMEKIIDLK